MNLTRKPEWLKVRAPGGDRHADLKRRLRGLNLNTVCEEARCPNIGECWNSGTATVMILGDMCTRGCRFCDVNTGKPQITDWLEPGRVGDAICAMEVDYVVITSVNRDDLDDGGAQIFGMTVKAVKARQPEILVEVLTPDFGGQMDAVQMVLDAMPDTFAHNVETVERLQRTVRDVRATYAQSLAVLEYAKTNAVQKIALTKSSVMLGLGESHDEVVQTMKDLRGVGCDVVTFGQYLRPANRHLKVEEYVPPERFDEFRDIALDMGFVYCASGPLVRSSYKAGEFFMKHYLDRRRALEAATS